VVGLQNIITKREIINDVCGPMDSAWPMFGHNPQRTGRSPNGMMGDAIVEKWKFKMEGMIKSSPAIDEDGTIYIGSTFGNYLFAINPDGSEKWRFKAGYWIQSSPAIAEDGAIYAGSDEGKLYAVNPNGTLKWNLHIGAGWSYSSPLIDEDGLIYTASVIGSNICAVYLNNGTKKWDYKTNGWIYSSPTLDSEGNIYIGSHDGHLYSLFSNGTLKWKYNTNDEVKSIPAIGEDGTIYVGSWNGYLYALYSNGTLKWKFKTGSSIDASPTIAEDGTIYVGSYNGMFFSINPDGTENWRYKTDKEFFSSAAIDKHGVIYIGSMDGDFYVFNPDGTLKCRFETGEHGEFWESSPIIGEDGTIYCAASFNEPDSYSYLYALTLIENDPPEIPLITGKLTGNTGVEYNFTIVTSDPDGDNVSYWIDWGDGKNSGWLGMYESDVEINESHIWNDDGKYTVRVKARDQYATESDWATLEVTMPKIYIHNPILELLMKIVKCFPFFEKILNQILI
jgi:outer membrane protein assembly factor BamB